MSDAEQQDQKDQKPATGGESEHINVKVLEPDGNETFFKIKMSTKLGKLMTAYANKTGKEPSSIRFIYDGATVTANDTPTSLDMEDNDALEVHIEQVGGR